MNSGVYVITNQINGRRYVGSAVDLKKRMREHLYMLGRGLHRNPHLQSAFDKYGADAFVFEVLEECAPEFIVSMEQWWLNMLRPEYNIAPRAGSNLGCKHTAETIEKHAAALRGRKHTPEHRAKISSGNMGKHSQARTPEWKAKISASMMGKRNNLGRKHGAEERAKNGAANKGRTPWNKGKTTSTEARAKQSSAAKLRWAANRSN